MLRILLVVYFLQGSLLALSQVNWDDTINKEWPAGFVKATITASADGKQQPMILRKAKRPNQPLIVSLHSWSGDYLQADSISWEVAERDWNYVHPHFRGPNWTPEACGSPLVVRDIDDAIRYALAQTGANPAEVHVVGASGGGHATMLCYMLLPYPAKSFSAWVGISNLEDWYYESLGRGQRYAKDILKATGDTLQLNIEAVKKRSPYFQPLPARQAPLYLYAGIHDGYQGSVPVTQTIQMYNRLAAEKFGAPDSAKVGAHETLEMLSKRSIVHNTAHRVLGNRLVHLFKQSGNVSVCIFEGRHEQVVPAVLALLPVGAKTPNRQWRVLTLGDSNGATAHGWPQQLRFALPYVQLFNYSKAGNSIGFNNNGDTGLNQLHNLPQTIQAAKEKWAGKAPDYVVLMLGTNDAKSVYAGQQKKVADHFKQLLLGITKALPAARLIVIAPPPVNETQKAAAEKYSGAGKRLKQLRRYMQKTSAAAGAQYIDPGPALLAGLENYTSDGVHYKAAAQALIARMVAAAIAEH